MIARALITEDMPLVHGPWIPPPIARGWIPPAAPQPVGRFDDKTGLWRLTELWEAMVAPGLKMVVIPGAESDGASIPWFVQSAFSPRYERKTFPAAFGHDLLYLSELFPRHYCDQWFRWQLLARGVSPVKADLYFAAVVSCGWRPWSRHTPAQIERGRELVILADAMAGEFVEVPA